jgi:CO/xanthine dehydrogenase FAD-binding subunit
MLARPGLPEFDYVKARTAQEVFQLLNENGPEVRLLMGGTDLFIQMRDRDQGPRILLDVKELPGMGEISFDQKTGLRVGAALTLNKLSCHQAVKEHYPVLGLAADTIGNYQLRNRATFGGNLCNASPGADMAPASLVCGGQVILKSPRGERVLDLEEFWTGPGKTALAADEYLAAIHFPPPPSHTAGTYLKLGRSKMGDLAIVGVAVLGFPDPDCPAGLRFRIGINSTAPTPYRIPEVEEGLSRSELSEENLHKAAESAMKISAPIEDVRATAAYQKKMVRNLTYRALLDTWLSLQ